MSLVWFSAKEKLSANQFVEVCLAGNMHQEIQAATFHKSLTRTNLSYIDWLWQYLGISLLLYCPESKLHIACSLVSVLSICIIKYHAIPHCPRKKNLFKPVKVLGKRISPKKKKSKWIHLCVISHLEGKDSNATQTLPTWLLLGKCRGNGVHRIIFCREGYKRELLWDKPEKILDSWHSEFPNSTLLQSKVIFPFSTVHMHHM